MQSGNKSRQCVNCEEFFNLKPAEETSIVNGVTVDRDCLVFVETIKLPTALSDLYKLNYLDELKFPNDKNDPLSLPSQEEEDESDLSGLCQKCKKVLVSLFKYYYEFNKLRKVNSRLSKRIKKLDELILRVQSLIHKQGSIISNNKYEESLESNDEAEEDPSNFVQCEFQDENDGQHPPSLKIETEQHSNNNREGEDKKTKNVKSTTISPFPTVLINRLTNEQIIASTSRVSRGRSKRSKVEVKYVPESPLDNFEDESLHHDDSYMGSESSDEEEFESKPLVTPKTTTTTKSKGLKRKKTKEKSEKRRSQLFPDPMNIITDGTCPLCQKTYTIPSNMSTHIATHVDDRANNTCPIPNCSKCFGRRDSLLAHLKLHAGDLQYKCPLQNCDKVFSRLRDKFRHTKGHWKEGIYICGKAKCDKVFSSKELLDEHLTSVHQKTNECPACPEKTFDTEKSVNAHIAADHPGEKLFLCRICLQTYARKKLLVAHMVSHGTTKCPKGCGRKFKSSAKLEKHKEICQGVEKYLCSLCSKSFRDRRSLEVHEMIHQGEQPTFKCTHPGCNTECYTEYKLRVHLKSHSKIRNFGCEYCGLAFKTMHGLRQHYIVHEEKSLVCNYCGKPFLRAEGLKKHLRTHSDVKLYKCEVCAKEFKYSESKRLHFLTQHQETPAFSCTVCGMGFPYNFSLKKHMSKAHPSIGEGDSSE